MMIQPASRVVLFAGACKPTRNHNTFRLHARFRFGVPVQGKDKDPVLLSKFALCFRAVCKFREGKDILMLVEFLNCIPIF